MKIVLKILLTVLLVIIAAVVGLLLWLTLTEYKPAATEAVAVETYGKSTGAVETGKELTLLSWNIGYGGLGKQEDFFMDGGKSARPKSKDNVTAYLNGITQTIGDMDADIVLLQEVDSDCTRTYGTDERQILRQGFATGTFALNYSCPFVPVPFPPMAKVNSGIMTLTESLTINSAKRISLYCPFSWPLRIANLKRCLLVSYIPVKGSDRYLVLVNFHLEAYTDPEKLGIQTKQLMDVITEEYARGNYVIAGGDFNQFLPGSRAVYPQVSTDWNPSEFDSSILPAGWTLAYDLSVPTCRSLNQPYDPTDPTTQYYSIDGLILSPNVKMLGVQTIDKGFEYSDHNPVRLEFVLN